jgi:hypothetical protein
MTWFLFTSAETRNKTARSLRVASHGSTFFRMRVTTCSRLRTEADARVGHVPVTASGLLSAGVRASSTHAARRQRFSRFGLETWPNPIKPGPINRQILSRPLPHFMKYLAFSLCFIGLLGCSTPNPNTQATLSAYEQVRSGMTRSEVYTLLGQPQSVEPAGDAAHCRKATWSIPSESRGRGHWTVTFAGDTVTGVKSSRAIVSVSP